MTTLSFAETIEVNKKAERAPVDLSFLEALDGSRLLVRNRGCFITDFSVLDQDSGKRIHILYSDADLETPKLTASHVMSPAGPSDGIGGQHGFARWADYTETSQPDGDDGEKLTLFESKRNGFGQGISKAFDMSDGMLTTSTTLTNFESDPLHTSIGEHLYFALENEVADGLLLNGQSLDAILDEEGAQADIMAGNAHFWPDYSGNAEITFPAGHTITLRAAAITVDEAAQLGMLIWHKPGSPSICFEPTMGLTGIGINEGLEIKQHETASLITFIDVRPITR